MSNAPESGRFAALHKALQAGEMSRREFTLRALALGVAMPGRHIGWNIAAQGVAGARVQRPARVLGEREMGEGVPDDAAVHPDLGASPGMPRRLLG